MTRDYSSKTNVRLPHLVADDDVLLGNDLVNAANGERRLPAPIAKRLERMEVAREALSASLRQRVENTAAIERDRKEAHNNEVVAWSALRARVEAHRRLPGDESSESVRRIEAVLFAGGVEFFRLPYKRAWMEGDHRLKVAQQQELEDSIRELCGDKFYEKVLEAHDKAAEVFGITDLEPDKPDVNLRKRRDAFEDALRAYVGFVGMHADEDEAAAALAKRLLKPIVRWQTVRSKPSANEPALEAPPPVVPTPTQPE